MKFSSRHLQSVKNEFNKACRNRDDEDRPLGTPKLCLIHKEDLQRAHPWVLNNCNVMMYTK